MFIILTVISEKFLHYNYLMGNEKSALNGIEIDEKAIEVTDFWTQYSANVQNYNSQKVSVFNSEPSLHYTASFGKPTPLERIAKVSSSVVFTSRD